MSHDLKRIGVHDLICTFLAPLSRIVKRYNLGSLEVRRQGEGYMPSEDTLCMVAALGVEGQKEEKRTKRYAEKDLITAAFFRDGAVEFFRDGNWVDLNSSPFQWLAACLKIVDFYLEEIGRLLPEGAFCDHLTAALKNARSAIGFSFMAAHDNLIKWPHKIL